MLVRRVEHTPTNNDTSSASYIPSPTFLPAALQDRFQFQGMGLAAVWSEALSLEGSHKKLHEVDRDGEAEEIERQRPMAESGEDEDGSLDPSIPTRFPVSPHHWCPSLDTRRGEELLPFAADLPYGIFAASWTTATPAVIPPRPRTGYLLRNGAGSRTLHDPSRRGVSVGLADDQLQCSHTEDLITGVDFARRPPDS
jgi:hypothetical protein